MSTKTLKGSVTVTATSTQPEPKVLEGFPVEAGKVEIREERTKQIALPANLYLEQDPATVTKHRGHQVDPSRPASWIGVMPNVDLLASSGNPYPADGSHETVVTADKYRPLVKVAHATWSALSGRKGEWVLTGSPNIIAEVAKVTKVPDNADLRNAVRDACRDLVLFGLVERAAIGPMRGYRLRA